MLGARVRHSACGKGHEEGGSTYAKAGSGLRSPPGNPQAPRPRGCSGLGEPRPSAPQLLAFSPGKEQAAGVRDSLIPEHGREGVGGAGDTTSGTRPPERVCAP